VVGGVGPAILLKRPDMWDVTPWNKKARHIPRVSNKTREKRGDELASGVDEGEKLAMSTGACGSWVGWYVVSVGRGGVHGGNCVRGEKMLQESFKDKHNGFDWVKRGKGRGATYRFQGRHWLTVFGFTQLGKGHGPGPNPKPHHTKKHKKKKKKQQKKKLYQPRTGGGGGGGGATPGGGPVCRCSGSRT